MNSQIFRQATRATARFASTQARLFASSTKSAPADYGRLFQQARRTGIVYVFSPFAHNHSVYIYMNILY